MTKENEVNKRLYLIIIDQCLYISIKKSTN
jgi:hypothetical protein